MTLDANRPDLTVGVLGTGAKFDVTPDQYLDLAFWEGLYKALSAEDKAATKEAAR